MIGSLCKQSDILVWGFELSHQYVGWGSEETGSYKKVGWTSQQRSGETCNALSLHYWKFGGWK